MTNAPTSMINVCPSSIRVSVGEWCGRAALIGPVATMVFAWMFLGENMTTVQISGAALVLAGALIISLQPRPAQD